MKKLIIATALILSACSAPVAEQEVLPEGNVGAACTADIECQTPMSYLTRSSCPFTSLCMSGKCAVVCPMANPDPNAEASETYHLQCAADSDCECTGYAAQDMKRCACVNDMCVAVVAE